MFYGTLLVGHIQDHLDKYLSTQWITFAAVLYFPDTALCVKNVTGLQCLVRLRQNHNCFLRYRTTNDSASCI